MMVGVPVLLVVCDSAPVPLTCVMAVGVGVFWWRVFQWWVAVVPASRRVPGVVVWLVCVVWFRMLMCVRLFPCFCFVVLVLLVCLVNNAACAGWVGLVCVCCGV